MALNRYVIMFVVGYLGPVVMMVALLDVGGAAGHFQDTNVLDFRAAALVVLGDTGMHAFAATDAAAQVQGIDKFYSVHRFDVFDFRADGVAAFDFIGNAFQGGGHFIR